MKQVWVLEIFQIEENFLPAVPTYLPTSECIQRDLSSIEICAEMYVI